jgi:hypothetical protein
MERFIVALMYGILASTILFFAFFGFGSIVFAFKELGMTFSSLYHYFGSLINTSIFLVVVFTYFIYKYNR